MVDLDIIEPVQKSTDWVNGLVLAEKPNRKLWVCLDPRLLNKAIKPEQGNFTASEVFQKEITSIISDIPGSANSQDDFVVWGKTLQEHDKCLRKVFLTIRESGLKLNKTKCQIRKQSIVFLGHIISSEVIKIDPSKTEAITKMPLPRSVNDLQRFLGMINYLGKFIPNLAEHATPLRNLLKKDVVFKLQKPQFDAIENLKTLVTSTPCLKIFDSNLPTRLKTDASSLGLGAFLEQNYGTVTNEKCHPIGYSSRALRDYEKRYAQIKGNPLNSFWSRTLS